MSLIKIRLTQFIIVVSLVLISDYIFTKRNGNEYIVKKESAYRIRHDIFHHSLAPSFNGLGFWGGRAYKICTDGNGFKSDCDHIHKSIKIFDVGFMGDSFTEAIGLPYENSFVGMFAKSKADLEVANLGVSSYSPTIYRAKIEHLLRKGFFFNHLVIFIDISDIQNETMYFRDKNGAIYSTADKANNETTESRNWLSELKFFFKNNFALSANLLRKIRSLLIDHKNKSPTETDYSDWTYNKSSAAFGNLGVDGAIEKAVREMELLYEVLKSKDIKLSIGVYPWPTQLKEMATNNSDANLQVDIWRAFCATRCENFVNMFPAYFKLIKASSVDDVYRTHFITGDVHYNFQGNRLIHEALLELNLVE